MSLYIFLLLALDSWVYAECYYPDKTIVDNYQPCNPAQENGTACCDLSNSVCSTAGYCYGSARFLYRGGCTDPDWASPNCAKNCVNIAQGTFSNILPCSSGVFTEEFCCSDVARSAAASQSCCSNSFNFQPGPPYIASSNVQEDTYVSILSVSSITGSSSSAQISSSTQTSSSAQTSSSIAASTNTALSGTLVPSPTPSAHTTSKNSTAIGVGVGVPLGMFLLLSLGFLLYRERQRQTMMESLKRENQTILSRMGQRQPYDGYPTVSNTVAPQELEDTRGAPGELDSHSGPNRIWVS